MHVRQACIEQGSCIIKYIKYQQRYLSMILV